MADLTEKVEALEKRLDKLSDVFDHIRKSLTTENPKRRHSGRTKILGGRPEWVKEIVQHFNDISAELKSVKKTLDTRSFTETGTSPSDASATNAPEPELQHEAPAIDESGQREPVAANAPASERLPSPPSPLGQHIATKEPPPQAHHVPVGCKVSFTPSTSTEHVDRTMQLNDTSLNLQSEEGNAPTFHCNYEDISGNLNEGKLEHFSSDPRVKKMGFFKFTVGDLPPLNVREANFVQPGKDHCTNFSCQSDSRGFVKLSKEQNREIVFPSFPLPESKKESWSQEELKQFWETTLRKLPQDMSYVIGDPLFPDIELSPGEGLKRIEGYEDLSGIGTAYAYLSGGVCFSIMHKEDAEFLSLNLLRSGSHKLWLLVEPAYGEKLELHMRQEFPEMATCSQAVRHLSRAILPSKFDEWKISYSLIYTKPGEGVVTMRGTYHQVLNEDGNYAIAINLLPGSLPPIPKGYKFCQKNCDPHAITAAHLRLREEGNPLVEVQANKRTYPSRDKITAVQSNIISSKRNTRQAESQANKRTRLPGDRVTAVPSNTIPLKRKAVPIEPQSRTPLVTAHIGSLSDAVCGKEAFHRLSSRIYSWRDRSKSFLTENNRESPAVRLVHAISTLEKRSHLTEFLDRFAKLKLAKVIDDGLDGRMRADPSAITNLLTDLGWENNRSNRKTLHNYLAEGRQWGRICDNFDGLLCLIPSNREYGETLLVTGRMYQELPDKDIELFHSLLKANEFVQPMCRVGEIFQASIWSGEEVPEFKWESENPREISRLSMTGLAPFMGKFRVITENEHKLNKHDWPKPDRWPWDWPQHPMWVPDSDRRCDLCDKEKCNCISTCLPENKPRITNEIGRGQGVRVIGSTWVKGQILGEFYGEVVPLETYHDGCSMEFIRPDLDNEPVAQIYAKDMGNWLRKVNHSCDPSTKFRVMKISGWWRQMLVAIRDIPHNGEITASCGRNFLKRQGKECLCELCVGRLTPQQG